MTKRTVVVIAALGFSMTACNKREVDNDPGTVVERSRRVVVVLEDDGEREKHSIHKRSRKCQVGERWPECKK
jgi:hypothetical protein